MVRSVQDFIWEGVEVGQLFESNGFRENGGKPKHEIWPQ
jgi:hypothetical protein